MTEDDSDFKLYIFGNKIILFLFFINFKEIRGFLQTENCLVKIFIFQLLFVSE